MKRYTVVWHQLAKDDLAKIWLAATDRRAVTSAADRIDVLLANNPAEHGSEVSPRTRERSAILTHSHPDIEVID